MKIDILKACEFELIDQKNGMFTYWDSFAELTFTTGEKLTDKDIIFHALRRRYEAGKAFGSAHKLNQIKKILEIK